MFHLRIVLLLVHDNNDDRLENVTISIFDGESFKNSIWSCKNSSEEKSFGCTRDQTIEISIFSI